MVLLVLVVLASGCRRRRPPDEVGVGVINDTPNATWAFVVRACSGIWDFTSPTDMTGRGAHAIHIPTMLQCPGCSNVDVTEVRCANGKVIREQTLGEFRLNACRDYPFKRTFDCRLDPPSSMNCDTLYNTLRRIERFENSTPDGTCSSYPPDFGLESIRELFVRDFGAQHATHQREAEAMYSWLLDASPPDNTIVQNLDAGYSLEWAGSYIMGGSQFFAEASNNNGTFVSHVYQAVLLRDPAQWERDAAVEELNGYWRWVYQPCPPECFEGGEPPPGDCGWWEWYQKSRDEFAWQILASHEFHQVVANTLGYAMQLRRAPTATEVENLSYYMDSTSSALEGAVVVLRSAEFYQKSPQPW